MRQKLDGKGTDSATVALMVMNKCCFCEQPAFAGLLPKLCEKHHELMLMVSYARRHEIAVNQANLLKLHQNTKRFKLRPEDIPTLLQQVKASWKR